jgi:hypothetical protein
MRHKGISDEGMKRIARMSGIQAQSVDGDVTQALSRGFESGNYDAASGGGDPDKSVEYAEDAFFDSDMDDSLMEAFCAGYVLAFVPGLTDSWMWDEEYLDAWHAWGTEARGLGIAVDDPYEAQSEEDI